MSPTLPRSTIFLTFLSLFLSICILMCSCLDLGRLSLWANPICAIFTMAYHLTLLFLVYTEPQKASMFFIMSIACAYLLALAWLGSFAIMAVLGCGGLTDLYLCGILVHIPQQPAAPQTLQFLLTPFECIIMADLAVRLSIQRRDAWKSMGYKGKMAGTGEDDCDTSNDSTECR